MTRAKLAVAEQPALPPAAGEPQRESNSQGLTSWALVELYGHRRIVGHVTADPVEMPGMIRVDVPDLIKNGEVARKGLTRYFGKGAIYSITPCDESSVRNMLPHVDGLPARPAYLSDF